ncbi:hypothetical protein Nmel_008162 [Mimus melanotis]
MEGEARSPPCLASFLFRRLPGSLAAALPTLDFCRGSSQGPGVPGGCCQPTWPSGPSACVGPLSLLAHLSHRINWIGKGLRCVQSHSVVTGHLEIV